MTKYIYNNTEAEKTYVGKSIQAGEYYLIPANMEIAFSMTNALFTDIGNQEAIVSTSNDSSGHLSVSDGIDFLKGDLPPQVEAQTYPFGSKVLQDGSRLFRRVRGLSSSIDNASKNIDFVVPFTKCKITGLQILGAKLGDKATFQVLDTASGTISGVPNLVLNTFGQDVYVAPDKADYPSKYDADLIQGMTLRIVFDAVDQVLNPPRTVYVNFDLHEVVS